MNTLVINTALSNSFVAFLKNNKQIDTKFIKSGMESQQLLRCIEQILQKHEIDYQAIKQIYFINGPGSFTGLRVGATITNTISYLTNATIHNINSFQFLKTIFGLENQFIALKSTRQSLFITNATNCEIHQIKNITNNQFMESYQNKPIYTNLESNQLAEFTNIKSFKIDEKIITKLPNLIKLAIPKEFQANITYIKPPQITMKKICGN